MHIFQINPSFRYRLEKAVRHPFITRKKYDKIQKTFNEILYFRNNQKNMKDIV